MAKGKKKNQNSTATEAGGLSNARNVLSAKLEASLLDQLRPGRHPCRCQARIHKLVRNCMGCGKIVCQQEGSGPCFYCGNLVCTREEQEVLDRGSKKSNELYERLMGGGSKGLSLSSIGDDVRKSTEFRNRLLEADADTERRTKVNDLESDYTSMDNSPYLTAEEREHLIRRRDELLKLKHQRKPVVINFNLADFTFEEKPATTVNIGKDPVIQSLFEKSEERRRAAEASHNSACDSSLVPAEFIPKYDPSIGQRISSNVNKFKNLKCEGVEELSRYECESDGHVISFPQPLATIVANGLIKFVAWPFDVEIRGPVYVAANDHNPSANEIKSVLDKYSIKPNISLRFDSNCLLGNVDLIDCVTQKQLSEEFNKATVLGTGKFILKIDNCLPFVKPIDHISNSNLYKLDEKLRKDLTGGFGL